MGLEFPGMCNFAHPTMKVAAAAGSSCNTIVTMSHDVPAWRDKILRSSRFRATPDAESDEEEDDDEEEPVDEKCGFGKYCGKMFSDIIQKDRKYVDFCRENAGGNSGGNSMQRLVAYADAHAGSEVCDFGKHEGKTFEAICEKDPSYLSWCQRTFATPHGQMKRLLAFADQSGSRAGEGSSENAEHGLVFYSDLEPEAAKKKLVKLFGGRSELFDSQYAQLLNSFARRGGGPSSSSSSRRRTPY